MRSVPVLLLVTLLLCSVAAAGEKTYDAADLRGTYDFITQQVRMEYPPGGGDAQINYCSGYGTVTFDGSSMMTGTSTDRCSLGGTTVDTMAQSYVMDPDGSFILSETAYPYSSTHCKLAGRGTMVLCDGTLSGPDTISFSAVGVKK